MTFNAKFLIMLWLLSISTSAFSESVIEGGLGVKLGDYFSGSKVIGNTTSEVPIYEFSPSKPLPKLDRYGVIVTPKTRKIVEIWAQLLRVSSSLSDLRSLSIRNTEATNQMLLHSVRL